jgi:hypothetical protein
MTKLVEINLHPDRRTLRQFGVIAFVGFGALAALAYYEKLVFSFGLGEARIPLTAGFAIVGSIALLFSLIIGPVAVLMRLFGRDPMHRRYDPKAATYWSSARPPRDKESYFHQY